MIRCLSCFKEYDDSDSSVCPFCGKGDITPREPIDLIPGTVLSGRYLIGEDVGNGGFGIIYKAFDLKFENIIAVKEYYPGRIVTRAVGTKEIIVNSKGHEEFEYRKERFLAEARNMAKLGKHKNIPNVYEYFEENNTAYIVMEFLEGITLRSMINSPEYIPNSEFAVFTTNEIGCALEDLHKFGILHRDVAPDNIFICTEKELKIKLLDLGAARLADDNEDIVDIVLKPGYSPIEQYTDDKKGRKSIDERSDIYALGATLYHMLTGVKPDESSNRIIEDEVIEPSKINSTIDQNLSNAIMKAIATDKHLRFNSVTDFLSAVNGNRKVVELKVEKRQRKLKQIAMVAMSIFVVIIFAVLLANYYKSKRDAMFLPDSNITVWYISDGGEGKDEAMEYIISDFTNAFPNVEVELCSFSEDEYYCALEDAAASGNMPTLFESSRASSDVLSLTNNLDDVINSEQAEDCIFLNQYEDCYPESNQIPLAIEVPMVCVITNGHTMIDYDSNTFSSLDDFDSEVISIDEAALTLAQRNFDYDSYAPMEDFMDNEANSSAVLVTSTLRINDIRSALTSYEKIFAYPDMENIECNYIYEWSICSSDDSDIEAAERLLSWMLGNVYQSVLMINMAGDGEIPINNVAYNTRISQGDYYSGLAGNLSNQFVFE